jgi:NADPH2:quinone reductase
MMCVLDQDLPSIVPKKGEVVLEVKAAAVNFPDILILQGKYQFKVDTKHEL